jgi:hypothetical protein
MGAPVDVHSAAAEQAHDIAVARKDILLLTDGLRAEREKGPARWVDGQVLFVNGGIA